MNLETLLKNNMITIKDFAKLHNKKRQYINKLIKRGRIKPAPIKLGNMYIFTGKEKIMPVKIGRPNKILIISNKKRKFHRGIDINIQYD